MDQHPTSALLHRGATFQPSTVDAESRTVQVVWSAGSDVRRRSWDEGEFIERLSMEPSSVDLSRMNNGAPVLNSHQKESLDDVLGVVERAWLENGEGRAVLRFSSREDVQPIWNDVREGIIRNISVGYSVGAWKRMDGATRDEPPVLLAERWTPFEVSMVAVGADPKASIREADQSTPSLREMSNETPKAGAEPAITEQENATRSLDTAPVAKPEPAAAVAVELERSIAELRRENKILSMANKVGLSDDATRQLIDSGKPVDECAVAVFEHMRDTNPSLTAPAGHPAMGVTVTRDSGDTLLRGIEEGLSARVQVGKPMTDLGREFRSYTLLEMTRQYLESRGVNTRGMSKTELVQRGFHSTSDFPLLFSNLAGKTLDAAYQEEPHTWKPLCRQRNLPDFKEANDLIIAGALTPEPLLEGGEYKAGTLQEAQHTWKLATYARKVTVTRQAIINDDLSALERVPEMLGRGFRRLESNLIWELITGDAITSVDGLALFKAAHANSSAQTLTTSGFNAARKAMRKQTDIAGNTINLTPSYMMVPTDLEATALQFLFPTGFAPAQRTGADGPVTAQTAGVQLIVEPRLDGSATTWYLAASPGAVEGIVYGYLAGEEGPTVTTTEKRDPDGVELLARFDFGAAVKDYRGFFRAAAATA
jgi:hypothetical protein